MQQAAQTAAYEPFGRLSTYGTGLTGLAGGVAGQQFETPAAPSPFSTALSTAVLEIYSANLGINHETIK
jgi:hypothetical protein